MAANDNAIACGADLKLLDLLAAAIGKDSSGKASIRFYKSNATAGSKLFACGTSIDEETLEAGIASLFTLDSNGDIAIRATLP